MGKDQKVSGARGKKNKQAEGTRGQKVNSCQELTKNNHKQILCSFITKYSATINIAFFFTCIWKCYLCLLWELTSVSVRLKNLTQGQSLLSVRKMSFGDVNRTQTLLEEELNKTRVTENKSRTSVVVLGRTSILERQGSTGGANDPCSQRAKSLKNKNQLCVPQRPLLDNSGVCRTAAAIGLIGP